MPKGDMGLLLCAQGSCLLRMHLLPGAPVMRGTLRPERSASCSYVWLHPDVLRRLLSASTPSALSPSSGKDLLFFLFFFFRFPFSSFIFPSAFS